MASGQPEEETPAPRESPRIDDTDADLKKSAAAWEPPPSPRAEEAPPAPAMPSASALLSELPGSDFAPVGAEFVIEGLARNGVLCPVEAGATVVFTKAVFVSKVYDPEAPAVSHNKAPPPSEPIAPTPEPVVPSPLAVAPQPAVPEPMPVAPPPEVAITAEAAEVTPPRTPGSPGTTTSQTPGSSGTNTPRLFVEDDEVRPSPPLMDRPRPKIIALDPYASEKTLTEIRIRLRGAVPGTRPRSITTMLPGIAIKPRNFASAARSAAGARVAVAPAPTEPPSRAALVKAALRAAAATAVAREESPEPKSGDLRSPGFAPLPPHATPFAMFAPRVLPAAPLRNKAPAVAAEPASNEVTAVAVEPAPVEPAPVEPAPVEPAPVEPAPVEPVLSPPAPAEPVAALSAPKPSAPKPALIDAFQMANGEITALIPGVYRVGWQAHVLEGARLGLQVFTETDWELCERSCVEAVRAGSSYISSEVLIDATKPKTTVRLVNVGADTLTLIPFVIKQNSTLASIVLTRVQ